MYKLSQSTSMRRALYSPFVINNVYKSKLIVRNLNTTSVVFGKSATATKGYTLVDPKLREDMSVMVDGKMPKIKVI